MSNIKVDYDILNQKQTPAFYASSLATRPAFGFPGRIFIDTDTPSSGIYRDTGSAWVQVADPGAGTTGTLQQVTTNGNTTTLGIVVQGININDGAGTGSSNVAIGSGLQNNTTGSANTSLGLNSLTANTTANNNTAIGNNSLQLNTTGANNTSIGSNSLSNNTTASFNTAIGASSLNLNTTGANNTALGNSSLASNTTASFNTAIGATSLQLNTTGGSNTAIGYQTLTANTIGANNTAIGLSALFGNTTASFNTAIGSSSLQNNTTGTQNTAIGYLSLSANTTGLQNTALGNETLLSNTTGFGNVAMGYASMTLNTTGELNIGIGGSALTRNTTGVRNTAIGIAAGSLITTGSYNTLLGAYAGTSTLTSNIVLSDGLGNVRLFSNDTGKVGINVPITDTPTGQVDIHTSLTNALVLNGNTTNNAYLGLASAGVNKWRIGNTYNAGANSFDIYNLGTSSTALSFNSTTNNAVFSGKVGTNGSPGTNYPLEAYIDSSTAYTTSSRGNILRVLNTNTTANTYAGIELSAEGTANSGAAGINAVVTGSGSAALTFYTRNSNTFLEKVRISSAGNVGIGTNSPDWPLTIKTDASANSIKIIGRSGGDNALAFYGSDASTLYGHIDIGTSYFQIFASNSQPIQFYTGGSERLQITNGGAININSAAIYTSAGCVNSQVSSSGDFIFSGLNTNATNPRGLYLRNSATTGGDYAIYFEAAGAAKFYVNGNGAISSTSTLITLLSSDYNLKTDIRDYDKGLNEILKMKPRYFKFKDNLNIDETGFIAQEMEEALPNSMIDVKDSLDSNNTHKSYQIDWYPILVKAIQELNEKLVRNNIN